MLWNGGIFGCADVFDVEKRRRACRGSLALGDDPTTCTINRTFGDLRLRNAIERTFFESLDVFDAIPHVDPNEIARLNFVDSTPP